LQDGALRLTAALGSGPQELVKLDLSYCGLSHHDFPKICANISLIGGLLELNLGGNYIGQEVCHFISRMPSHIVGSCVLICVVNSISGLLILCTSVLKNPLYNLTTTNRYVTWLKNTMFHNPGYFARNVRYVTLLT